MHATPRTDDEARERLRAEGPALVEHELFEVRDEVVEVLDVPFKPAREPVAPVVLPEDWGSIRLGGMGSQSQPHNTPRRVPYKIEWA